MANQRSPHEIYRALTKNINSVIRGHGESVRMILAGLAAGGHVLMNDTPGTGKATLAKIIARSIDAEYKRIQFTPDLLPSDITGVSIYDQKEAGFHLHKGPVFTNILLADEINRASPRTQSALLEAMAEGQVSIDGRFLELPRLFFVMATQNPMEAHGTYPLPESQMDRFALEISLGYVSREDELAVLSDQTRTHPLTRAAACVSLNDIYTLQDGVLNVRITDELKRYIVDLVAATRTAKDVLLGAGPRASLILMKTARALALFFGRDYVIPEDIQQIAVPVIAHRLQISPGAQYAGRTNRQIVWDILTHVPVPA